MNYRFNYGNIVLFVTIAQKPQNKLKINKTNNENKNKCKIFSKSEQGKFSNYMLIHKFHLVKWS